MIQLDMGGLLPQEKWDNTWLSKRKHKTFYLLCSFLPAGRTYPTDFDADLCSLAWYEVDVTCTNVANTAGFPGALVLLNKNI